MNAKAIRICLILWFLTGLPVHAREQRKNGSTTDKQPLILWQNPVDIRSRNLFYGPGSQENLPQGPFTFLKEDLHGTNPKFDVLDRNGIKWRVKLGVEARPEVAASHLLWAVGYSTREYYYLPVLRVENMPRRLKRGNKLIAADGTMDGVRLRRESGLKKIGICDGITIHLRVPGNSTA